MRLTIRPWMLGLALGAMFPACDGSVCVRNSDCPRGRSCIDAMCVEPEQDADTEAVGETDAHSIDVDEPAPEPPPESEATSDDGSDTSDDGSDTSDRGPVRRRDAQ